MISVDEYLKLNNKNPFYTSKPYDGQEEDKQAIIEYNKELIKMYPWLLPRNVWTGEVVEDYDYHYTELDSLPDGWYKAFGLDICKEIQEALEEAQRKNPDGGYEESAITTKYDSDKIIPYPEGYLIVEIKEKFGSLRWYDNGATQKVHDIIAKYERLSEGICIKCGKPAVWESTGWISFFCDDCAKSIFETEEAYAKANYSSYKPGKFENHFKPLEKSEENS